MGWRVARSLDVLLDEINEMAPHRSKVADGAIGDAAHASRTSDHNPWVRSGSTGVVTARDFTHDPARGCDAGEIAEFVRRLGKSGDRRVKYVISNARIASEIGDWKWRPYRGINAHRHHVHVSVSEEKRFYDSTARWGVDQEDEVKPEDIKAIARELRDLLVVDGLVPNQKLDPKDPTPKPMTIVGALSNVEKNQDQQVRADADDRKWAAADRALLKEIHAATVKPKP